MHLPNEALRPTNSTERDLQESVMREGIHPKYVPTTIKCGCGATFETRSTKGDYAVEICSQCHPLFTGKQKLVDTAGRVERFNRKYNRKKD